MSAVLQAGQREFQRHEWQDAESVDAEKMSRFAMICVVVGSNFATEHVTPTSDSRIAMNAGIGFVRAKGAFEFLYSELSADEYTRFRHAMIAVKHNKSSDGKWLKFPMYREPVSITSLETLHLAHYTLKEVSDALLVALSMK